MKAWAFSLISLSLFITTHSAVGAVTMDFTSGTITQQSSYLNGEPLWYPYGVIEYVEKGVTVTSLNSNGDYPCFFLSHGGLNLAMESGPVEFSSGGIPFDLESIDMSWLGTGDPNFGPYTFTSSNGGSIDVNVNGTFMFPNNSQWHSITSFRWTPHIWGWIDNVTINGIPEPSTYVFLLSGILPLYIAIKLKEYFHRHP
jgi:hypothetical protein